MVEPNYVENLQRNKEEIRRLLAKAIEAQYTADYCGHKIVELFREDVNTINFSQVEAVHRHLRYLYADCMNVDTARTTNDPLNPSFLDFSQIESWSRNDDRIERLLTIIKEAAPARDAEILADETYKLRWTAHDLIGHLQSNREDAPVYIADRWGANLHYIVEVAERVEMDEDESVLILIK